MALQIPDPTTLEQTIKLLKSDETGDTWVRIKQATVGEDTLLSALWAKTALEWDDQNQGRVRQYSEVNRAQIKAEAVRLTLLESNIIGPDGEILFPAIDHQVRRNINKFHKAWDTLLVEWADEIYDAVLEVNPQWRPVTSDGASPEGET